MRARTIALGMLFFLAATPATAQVEQLLRGPRDLAPQSGLSEGEIASGLKDALQVGTQNAVNLTAKTDGYFGNQAIKILMPEKLRALESGLRAIGYGPKVDEFVLSMNRAAERAAPAATQIFWEAIGSMSFEDARKIWSGGDTAATEYFRAKTSDALGNAFRPVVEKATNEVGVTRQFKDLMGRFRAIPFARVESLDVDQYVVGKALDGLFYILGEEEKKIRTNPVARTTDLLKEVFGK